MSRDQQALALLPWFHLPKLLDAGADAALSEEESRHAAGVLRLETGAEIGVFDGSGAAARATITDIAKRGRLVRLRLDKPVLIPAPRPAIHLAAALPKGDRQAVMLGMAAQWGIASFTPLLCQRSVVTPGRGFVERARRTCLESCKQCRRPRIPEIHEAIEPVALTSQALRLDRRVILAHPHDRALRDVWPVGCDDREVVILIGPEGGFSDDEVTAITAAGADAAGLGDTLLRMETAAASVIAWIRLASS
jgi:16S rRNA (uracil1498-N3)-methyltransferase